ncbi:MAG: hypothetical protein RLO08_16450 [Parvibaculaceae bacterium]
MKNGTVPKDPLRLSLIDAAIGLAAREQKIPDPQNLSEKTGIPAGKIVELYPNLDDLAADARAVSAARFRHLDDAMPAPGPLPDMLVELVDQRALLYETVGELRILQDAGETFLPSLAQARAFREGRYRGKLADMLAPHFEGRTLEITSRVELLTSWEAWRHLRVVQCLSVEQAKELILSLLASVASTGHERPGT